MSYLTIRDKVATTLPEYKFFDGKASQDDINGYFNMYDAFTNNGYHIEEDAEKGTRSAGRVSFRDLVTKEDLMRFVTPVVETIIREAIEPNIILTNELCQRINVDPGQKIQIGAVGTLEAGRASHNGELMEKNITLDNSGDMIAMSTNKYGLKISMTDEVVKNNQFDIVNLWLRAAGKALARCKERNVANIINEMGSTVIDNVTPEDSYFGTTTGRGIDGKQNGSMTSADVFELYAYLLNRGFTPDTLLMHPLAWKTFATDTEMREVVLAASTIANVRGPSAPNWGTSHHGFGLRTAGTGTENTSGNSVKGPNAWVKTLNPLGSQWQTSPSYLPTPLKVIVTPYVKFNPGSIGNERLDSGCTTNVVMVDSSNCAVLAQSLEPTVGSWNDYERDITKFKVIEEYGLQMLEQGKAVAIAANISIARNYNFANTNNVELEPLNIRTKPSGMIDPA